MNKWFKTALVLGVSAVIFSWGYRGALFPIQIGFAANLTGLRSELGVSGRNGALLAVEEVNRTGGLLGRNVELVVLDDKNDVEVARAIDAQFVKQGIEVVIGHMVSGMAKMSVDYANQQKLLFISPTISTEELTGRDDFFIRVIPSNSIQGKSLARAVLRQTTARNVAIVYDQGNELFATPIIRVFGEVFAGEGGRIAATMSFSRQSDFKNIVREIRRSDVDGVVVIASALDAAMFCQQSKVNPLDVPVFLPMWAMTNDLIQAGGRTVEGVYVINQVDLVNQTQEYQKFYQRFKVRYGEEPTFAAVLSYNAALVAFEGIKGANSTRGAAVKDAILRQARFPGLYGDQVLDQYGDTQREYFLYRVQNGIFKKVES